MAQRLLSECPVCHFNVNVKRFLSPGRYRLGFKVRLHETKSGGRGRIQNLFHPVPRELYEMVLVAWVDRIRGVLRWLVHEVSETRLVSESQLEDLERELRKVAQPISTSVANSASATAVSGLLRSLGVFESGWTGRSATPPRSRSLIKSRSR